MLIGSIGSYPVMGGRDWQVHTPHGSRSGVMWSSDGFGKLLSVAYSLDHAFAGTTTNTDSYHTFFPVTSTFRLKALILPLYQYTGGGKTVDVKLGLYQKQTDRVGWSYKLADPRLTFQLLAEEPSGGSPLLIPFSDGKQDGLVLRKGVDLYVRAVWGSAMFNVSASKHAARQPFEFDVSGDNCFRSDRYISGGSDFTQDIAVLMSTQYGTVFGTSLSGNTTSMARIDWGMYGDYLD